MHKLEDPRLRNVLEETELRIERHLRSLDEAQRFLKEAVAGKPFLLVDASMGRAARTLHRTTEQLRQHDEGWAKLMDLYIDRLFDGTLPKDTVEIFHRLLGPGVEIVRSDPRYPIVPDDHFAAVGFTGSAANVSYSFDKLLSSQTVLDMDGITHGDMFQMNGAIYREAARRGLPVMGLCYGQQRISVERGGKVERGDRTKGLGMIDVVADNYATELLIGAVDQKIPDHGQVPGYHDEVVTEVGQQSAIIMRTSSAEPGKIYGMLHVADGQFTGDAEQDADLIKSTLLDGEHVAVTAQWHPEFEGFMPIMEFSATQDPSAFERNYAPGMAANLVKIMASVVQQHNRAA